MKVAAIQMVSAAQLAPNLVQARVLLEQAAAQGAELAVLPEHFYLLGHRDRDKLALIEPFGAGPMQDFLSSAARELGLWIVGGTLPLLPVDVRPGDDRASNSSLAFAPDGRCVARYDKLHLFRLDNGSEQFDESRTLVPGGEPVLFDLPSRDGHVWRIGMSVCYDLRFPELYRHYAAQGADLLLVPSAFTWHTGQAHWELLLRARAVENLAFVVAPAQGGLHENGRQTWGHTLMVDPWGEILARHEQGAAALVGELDPARIQLRRQQLPALGHRRL